MQSIISSRVVFRVIRPNVAQALQIRSFNSNNGSDDDHIRISKVSVGAATAGYVAGSLVFGVPGSLFAAASVYAAQQPGTIGKFSRKVGKSTYNGMEDIYKTLRKSMK